MSNNFYKWDSADPIWFYTLIFNQVAYRHHKTVLRVRDMIHGEDGWDNLSPKVPQVEQISYEMLYRTAWHASTAVEILEADIRSLADMINVHERLLDVTVQHPSKTDPASQNFKKSSPGKESDYLLHNPAHQELLFLSQIMHNMRLRCVTYKERANNDIQLAFSVIAKNEAERSKTLAFVAVIFIPPTLVTAFFSPSFFYSENAGKSWGTSSKIWICVVSMVVSAGLSYGWWYFHNRKSERKKEKIPVGNTDLSARERHQHTRPPRLAV